MGLETATYISQLDKLAPLSGDQRKQGDDHLRLIKSVLKATFPGKGGQGFAKPITATEDEINLLAGMTSNVKASLIPAGTRCLFYQLVAPTGWTIVTGLDNRTLIIGKGGTVGGVATHDLVKGCTVVASHIHAIDPASITIKTSDDTHFHTYQDVFWSENPGSISGIPTKPVPGSWGSGDQSKQDNVGFYLSANTGNDTHSHTAKVDIPKTNTVANTGASVWQPIYAACIVASKNAY